MDVMTNNMRDPLSQRPWEDNVQGVEGFKRTCLQLTRKDGEGLHVNANIWKEKIYVHIDICLCTCMYRKIYVYESQKR